MAVAALVILGLILTVFGLGGFVWGGRDGSIWLIALGVVSLIAAGYFQMMGSRKT